MECYRTNQLRGESAQWPVKRNKYIIYTHVTSIGHPRPTNLNYFSTLLATFNEDDSLSFSLWCLNTYSLEGTPLHICISYHSNCQEDYRLLCCVFWYCVSYRCLGAIPLPLGRGGGLGHLLRVPWLSHLAPGEHVAPFLWGDVAETLLSKCRLWPVDACTAVSWPSEGVLNP